MFSRIEGRLVERRTESALIDVGGLAYEVVLPPCVAGKIARDPGDPVTLEVYSVLALDGKSGRFTYYGFSNAIERAFFEALLSVASIGPRSAARAFSAPMSQIAQAIDRGDHAYLKTLPGIGQQKARDIVAKLQGKVARFLLIQDARAATVPAKPSLPSFAREALDVLLQLEYRRADAQAMISQALTDAPGIDDAERLLAEVYRRRSSTADEVPA
ncbi:MAG: Holliday junction branch migration protein RuvA [Candidatus Tyrphobacter sp.]